MESRYTLAGSELVTADSPAGRLGLTTCYDVRFPEMYARLVERGAQVRAACGGGLPIVVRVVQTYV